MNALMKQMPEDMMAVEMAAARGPEQLKLARRPTPCPGNGEVLIRGACRPGERSAARQTKCYGDYLTLMEAIK